MCRCEAHFLAAELVWVHSPQWKMGQFPKLDSQWVDHCRVLEKLDEVVYKMQRVPSPGEEGK